MLPEEAVAEMLRMAHARARLCEVTVDGKFRAERLPFLREIKTLAASAGRFILLTIRDGRGADTASATVPSP